MKTRRLKNHILLTYATVIAVLSVCFFSIGYYAVKIDIFQRIQGQVEFSLGSARTFYNEDIRRIGTMFEIADLGQSDATLCEKMRLHYFARISAEKAALHPSEIVRQSLVDQQGVGATRLIGADELAVLDKEVSSRVYTPIKKTQSARPTGRVFLDSAMAKEFALPLTDADGNVLEVLYGGRIINQDYEFVDRIRHLVFGDEQYNGLPVGTVTVFQDDVRIATNVVDEEGQRAIGTRISEAVYRQVVEGGRVWLDRANVVGHWYKAAYEPIHNLQHEIIGVLYVGILEEPFEAKAATLLLAFLIVITIASILAFVLAFVLSRSISKPLTQLLEGTERLSGGQFGHLIVRPHSPIAEMHQLAHSFNAMSVQLEEREVRLQEQHQKLTELNKSYMDLLGFVAHELKGLLASTILNAYSLRDGFLGMINFKQKRAVDSICRNLDYLAATVAKFLNLSRIERGKLDINSVRFYAGKDLFDISAQTFSKLITDKQMTLINEIDPELTIVGDRDLMLIVANNLVNNAAKYGTEGGRIILRSRVEGTQAELEVYNDGRPITADGRDMLFKKFSRLDNPDKKKVKGTGLGLYITKQIIEAHGGRIDVDAKPNGNSFIFSISKE